jgi:hypothetical protein
MTRQIFFSLTLVFLLGPAVWASNTGSISGLVTDPSGAVVPGVTVKAVNTATGIARSVTTNANGFYALLDLPVGTYDVNFHKEGFKEFRETGLVVDVTSPVRADATLQVGGVTQEVTVSSSAVLLDTQRTEMGEVIAGTHMTAMPLNGRGYTDLMALQPGVVPVSTGQYSTAVSPSGELNPGNLSVSGQRESANGFMVNGGTVEEGGNNGAAVIPDLDSIAEFRIQTNNFDSEYGNYSGGLINVVTKSGTNHFHGDAFEFLRNDKMDARNFYSYNQTNPVTGAEIPGSARAELHRNQFGGTIGGPIVRDKVFFFGDYQGTREVRGHPQLVLVPSASERTGNLAEASSSLTGSVSGPYWASVLSSELGYPVTQAEPYYTTGCTDSSQCVFPNAVIPQSAISAPAQALLKGGYIPLPNAGTFYSTSAFKGTLRDDKWSARIDGNTSLGMLSGYYFFDDFRTLNPFLSGSLPGFEGVVPGRSQQFNLGDTKSFGPTKVNELRLNYTRYAFWTGQPVGGLGPSLSSFGITDVYTGNPHSVGVPSVSTNEFSLGVNPFYELQVNNTYQVLDNFAKVLGTHALKLGGEFHSAQINLFDQGALNGTWSFNGTETGDDFADFLLGAVCGGCYNQGQQLPQYTRTHYYALYAQDSWRAKPNLTLNYGLRWEVSTPWTEIHNQLETLVYGVQSKAFPGAPTGWLVPTDPTVPHTVSPVRYNNFGPRVGLAYSPKAEGGISRRLFGGSGKSSIRASFGIFYTAYENATSFNAVGDAPFGYYYVNPVETFFATPFVNLPDGHNNGQRFPSPIPPLNVSASNPDTTLTRDDWERLFEPISSSPGFDHINRVPYAEHYMFSFERQVTPNTLLNLSYVGTQGHHLLSDQEANPGNPALCLSVSQLSQVLPNTVTCGAGGEGGVYYPVTGGTNNAACPAPGPACINSTRGPFGPSFGSDGLFSTMANSNYNALEASLRHTSGRLQFLVGYTYSKAMDNSSSWGPGGNASGGVEIINPINPKLGKSLSAFDVTHNFVASFVYELPFDKFLPPNRATRGWRISGITRFATGLPVFTTEQDDRSLLGTGGTGPTGAGIDEPNFTPGPLHITDPRKENLTASAPQATYFNTSLFSQEPLGHLGTANRRFFHGPGINNWDLGLFKELKLTESKSLEFRAEFFSVFNHAQFDNPDGNFIDSTFGLVTSAGGERVGQVAVKFFF